MKKWHHAEFNQSTIFWSNTYTTDNDIVDIFYRG